VSGVNELPQGFAKHALQKARGRRVEGHKKRGADGGRAKTGGLKDIPRSQESLNEGLCGPEVWAEKEGGGDEWVRTKKKGVIQRFLIHIAHFAGGGKEREKDEKKSIRSGGLLGKRGPSRGET